MSDNEDTSGYVSENMFTSTPSSSSIENTYRMGQVLQAKKDYTKAISTYLSVCETTERVIAMNPGANVEMQWVFLSLGNISDIYQIREDFNKASLYRNVQIDFLKYEQTQRQQGQANDDSDDETPNFVEIASRSHTYRALFEKLHEAMEAPEKPPPIDPRELVKQLQEARKKDEEAKIEATIKLLNEAADEREREIQNSFWRRNVNRVADHPVMFVLIVLLISILVLAFIKLRPKKKIALPGGVDAQMAYLEKYVKDYERKHGIKKDRAHLHDHKHEHDHHHNHMFDL